MNRAASLLAVFVVLSAAPLAATSFVMMTDPVLVDRTPLVVEARVLSIDDAPTGGTPSTDYLIEVERVLKGNVPGSNLIVRVAGGVGPDGIGLKIWGAPSFEAGERVVLFLRPTEDGTFRVAQLMLGAFHEVRAGGEPMLVRNLSEAHEVAAPGEAEDARARYLRPRHRAEFLDWIAQRASGIAAAEDYFYEPPPGTPEVVFEGFTLFESGGLNLRWFDFDGEQTVRWQVHQNGQPGLTNDQVIDAVGQGMGTWNDDAGSDVFYGFLTPRTTTSSGGLTDFDNRNVVMFENPNDNADFDGVFSCSSGGVLAIGGPWFQSTPQTHNGQQFKPIVGGDIITNKGLECFFNQQGGNRVTAAAELFGHELGHTLGLGHSCGDDSSPSCSSPALNDALMRAFIHGGNRGPRLGSDDLAGIRTLYGNGINPGPGPGTAPAAPSQLAAQFQGGSSVLLTWNDNSNNETGFRVQQRSGTGPFVNLANQPVDAESMVAGNLLPSTTYTWQVRALGASANSGFSNQVSLTTPAALPAAPSELVATPISPSVILLDWQDNSVNETGFVIEVASPVEDFHEIGSTGPGVTSFPVGSRVAGRPHTFRVRARNSALVSGPSNEASATTQNDPTAPCSADGDTLCLLGDRFKVEVQWRNQHPPFGNGVGDIQPSPVVGSKTGVFSFFNAANIELIVKMLDGGPVNGHYWLFYGGLSDVEYWVTVVDTATGESNTYHNAPGTICGRPDTAAFASSSTAAPAVAPVATAAAPLSALPGAGSSGTCVPGENTLCLADGRFAVTVDWTDQFLNNGLGVAVPGSEKTGYFWFFNDQNIELVVKLLDASTTPSANWWVFYGALSNVRYTITVLDTATGLETSYVNDPGNYCGDADTASFPDVP